MTKPKVFIGSSTEGLKYARAIQDELRDCSVPAVWNQVDLKLGQSVFDFLLESIDKYDFGIFVFVPDDTIQIRDIEKNVVRDNVIFEHGLFTGRLGKDRTFFITPKDLEKLHIPSDFQGLINARFSAEEAKEDLKPALATACNSISKEITRIGLKTLKEEESDNKKEFIPPLIGVEPEETNTTCLEDIKLRQNPLLVPETILYSDDKSNLNYLLLSVVNCIRSRQIIREVRSNPDTIRRFPSFELAGMYDIMGKWDLLIRFRLAQQANLEQLIQSIEDELERTGQMETNPNSLFATSDYVNVRQEVTSFNEINSNISQINHIRLRSTLDYEQQRCQKAFIYVQMPSTNQDRSSLINSLKEELQRNTDSKTIIEAISISEIAIIFEIFMRCSQTYLINRLNRVIEKTIPQYRLQKYTLFCFEYDEW